MSESKNLQRFPTRVADVGGIPIHRAIPQASLRKVGAWCFLDHAGPALPPPPGMQVGPHPHIGLQTFTWMIEGEVLHRDSLGTEQIIRPGEVNLMTAGHGIAHSEEAQTLGVHAAQLWIALPDSHRNIAPRFQHYSELPQTQLDDLSVTVLAGEALGLTSPAEVHSPLMGIDLLAGNTASTARATLPLRLDFEHAVMSMSGEVQVEGQVLPSEEVIYLPAGTKEVHLECTPNSRLIIIGGEPMDEAILVWWNFVGRTTEEMQQAQVQWEAEVSSDADTINGLPRRFGKPVASPLKSLHSPSLAGVSLRASK